MLINANPKNDFPKWKNKLSEPEHVDHSENTENA
jgi:hypothetical protein